MKSSDKDMLVRLYDLPEIEPVLKELEADGIKIKPAIAPDKHIVSGWVRKHFGEGWASEVEVAFSRQPVSCLIALEAGEILGFSCYDATCRGFLGPIGVRQDQRGRGIGKGLLLATLRAMYFKGYAYAIIGMTGLTKFYSIAGAVPIEGSNPGFFAERPNRNI